MADDRRNEGLGVFSLWMVAAALALPILASLAILVWRPDISGQDQYRAKVYILILFGGLEVFAVIAGLGGAASRAGKLGLVLAVLLGIGAGLLLGGARVKAWLSDEGEETGAPADTRAPPLPEPVDVPPAPPPPGRPVPAHPPASEERPRSPGELFPNVEPES